MLRRTGKLTIALFGLAAGLFILPSGHTRAAAEVLPIVVHDTFDDVEGNSDLADWSYPATTVSIVDRPKNGGTETLEEGNKALMSTIRTLGAAHRPVRKFPSLTGKLEINYDLRLDGKPIDQIKLPEIYAGATLLTSISAINSTINAENFFRFDIPTGPTKRIRYDSMPFKTWMAVKVEMDTETDSFSVWVDNTKVADNQPFYNDAKITEINEIRFSLTKSNVAAPNFYVDNLIVRGIPTPAPDVRETKLSTPPSVPVAAHIRNEHPRLFIQDFQDIKRKISSDYIPMNWYSRIKEQADELLNTPVRGFGTNPDNGAVLEHAREMENRTFLLSMAFQIERERKYLDRLWLEIQNTASYPTWKPESFLSVAEMLQAYAVAYDWNYYDWTEEQRKLIVDTMLDKGLTYGVDRYNGKSQGGTRFTEVTHNWNVVCNGGLMIAALAIANEYPDVAEFVLEKGTENIKKGLTAYAPLGAYPEGAMYWAYGTNYLTYTMAAFETAFEANFPRPEKYKLYEAPGVAKAPEFPIYLAGMTGSFNYGDSSIGKVNSPTMMWFAEKFNKPQYAWYYLRNQEAAEDSASVTSRGTVYALLWYNSAYRSITESFPLDKAYQNPNGTNSVLMRSSWQDTNGVYAGLKGGYNRENHSSLSIGTFILEAEGQRWATMRGAGNYDWPNYNDLTGGRFQYYNNRAEGQNTLVINPAKGGVDQDINATGTVVDYQSNSTEAFGIMDMSQAYARDVTSARRGMRLYDGRSKVLVQDEITSTLASDVWWFMHTAASIQIANHGKSVLLTQNGKRMWAHIADGPQDATFSVMDAKPFPWSPNPTIQSSNYGTKLAIHMKDVTSARLAVQFIPLKSGEAPPDEYAEVVNLSEWHAAPDDLQLLSEKLGDNAALLVNSPFAYAGGTKVMVNATNPVVSPVEVDGELMIPVEFTANALGANVERDEASGTTMIRYQERLVVLPLQEQTQGSNNESVTPSNPGIPQDGNKVIGNSVEVSPIVQSDGSARGKVDSKAFLDALKQVTPDDNGVQRIRLNVKPVDKATSYILDLPIDTMKAQRSKLVVEIGTPIGEVTLQGSLFSQPELTRFALVMEPVNPAQLDGLTPKAVGDRPIIRVNLLTDVAIPKQDTLLPSIGISLPYKPTAEELANSEHIVVWRIGADGAVVPIVDSKYDQATGRIGFHVRSLDPAVFVVTFVDKKFQDMNAYAWADKAVRVLASKGIIAGISEANFAPGEQMTRADFLMLLVKSLGLSAAFQDNFSDVDAKAYYAQAVGISRILGITEGMGGNQFEPQTPVSRQDIFTLTARALLIAGKMERMGLKADLSSFTDGTEVAQYAREGISLLAGAGILQGDDQGMRPKEQITRAEAAIMLYRIYNK
ncbi:hypothetical protein GC096_15685 [Paenibacillus sp. LMG 31461]|uniref:SLH domain-containing protein n=1 Tax=Paenibacillus plantarum TaxID=2654975 RepID=A0ABX1XBN9_9BACL|nr:S-layer homology domain-containing protein [Paenibacillus plantarum]NOU65476.1 hypothetical protein [Paenibacillus plantarum]